MRRVSYHQSVFHLLGTQPATSAQARALIEDCERRRGERLPEAVRQWYLLENANELLADYSNLHFLEPLAAVIREFAGVVLDGDPWWVRERIYFLAENQGDYCWFMKQDDTDDLPVFMDRFYDQPPEIHTPEKVADHFSDFVFGWIAHFYREKWTPLSERSPNEQQRTRPARPKPYLNGLYLHANAAEELAPPYLDFLIESFAEESRQEISPGVTQYRFTADDARLVVTTDDYGEEDGVSAWWLHADSDDRLYQLAKKVWWCCDLPSSLRHATNEARPVLDRLRGGK